MKKFLILALLPLFFSSCSSDEEESIKEQKKYEIHIHNRINKSKVSQKSDGILYDMYLLSQSGKIYQIGGVDVYGDLEYKLPSDYDSTKILFVILKLGRNSGEAYISHFLTPEHSYGVPLPIIVEDERTIDITITENTTFSSLPYYNIGEVRQRLNTIVDDLSK